MTCPHDAQDVAGEIDDIAIESCNVLIQAFEPVLQGGPRGGRRLLGFVHRLIAESLEFGQLEMDGEKVGRGPQDVSAVFGEKPLQNVEFGRHREEIVYHFLRRLKVAMDHGDLTRPFSIEERKAVKESADSADLVKGRHGVEWVETLLLEGRHLVFYDLDIVAGAHELLEALAGGLQLFFDAVLEPGIDRGLFLFEFLAIGGDFDEVIWRLEVFAYGLRG